VLPLIRTMRNELLTPAPFAPVESLDWAGEGSGTNLA
jgi:hypothetical protein